jgi:hypothetical protein
MGITIAESQIPNATGAKFPTTLVSKPLEMSGTAPLSISTIESRCISGFHSENIIQSVSAVRLMRPIEKCAAMVIAARLAA